jgi:hypothetical protein
MEITGNVIWGIVGSLIGVPLGLLAQEIIAYIKSRKGPLTDEWEQIIDAGGIAKRDRVRCRQIGDRLEGTIERVEPADQKYKMWRFQARIRGAMLFGMFWATDLKKNPGSYGTLQLHMIDYSTLEGFYVKSTTTPEKSKFIGQLKEFHFKWHRVT